MILRRLALIIAALSAALSLQLGPHASATEELAADLSLESWGFQRTIATPSWLRGSIQATLRSPDSGRVITQTYSLLGRLESESETTAAGRLLWRREIRGHATAYERFDGIHERVVSTILPGTDQIRIETTRWENGKARAMTTTLRREEALSACQATELPREKAELLIRDLNWLRFNPALTQQPGRVSLGQNIIAENCDGLPHGGNAALTKALEEGLKQGLQCFKALGPARRSDMARLLSYLDPQLSAPVLIRCGKPEKVSARGPRVPESSDYKKRTLSRGTTGQALFPGDEDFPGMLVNTASHGLAENPEELKATLFHEMLHFLGYSHGKEVDVPYLADSCCFANGKGGSSKACDLLRTEAEFTSDEYQSNFAEIMMNMDRSSIAVNAAWGAALRTNPNQLSPLWTVAKKLGQLDPDAPLYYLTLAYAGIETSPRSMRKELTRQLENSALPEVQREAAQAIGQFVGALIQKDARSIETNWPKTRQSLRVSCESATRPYPRWLMESLIKKSYGHLYFDVDRGTAERLFEELWEPCKGIPYPKSS